MICAQAIWITRVSFQGSPKRLFVNGHSTKHEVGSAKDYGPCAILASSSMIEFLRAVVGADFAFDQSLACSCLHPSNS